jgi:hypothetical protein
VGHSLLAQHEPAGRCPGQNWHDASLLLVAEVHMTVVAADLSH